MGHWWLYWLGRTVVSVGLEACLGYHAVKRTGYVEQGVTYNVGVALCGFNAFVSQ